MMLAVLYVCTAYADQVYCVLVAPGSEVRTEKGVSGYTRVHTYWVQECIGKLRRGVYLQYRGYAADVTVG